MLQTERRGDAGARVDVKCQGVVVHWDPRIKSWVSRLLAEVTEERGHVLYLLRSAGSSGKTCQIGWENNKTS